MRNKIEQWIRCQHCGKMLRCDTPPDAEAYEQARVDILDGVMLLPKACVKKEPDVATSHAITLNGIYCTPSCLVDFIHNALGISGKWVRVDSGGGGC